MDTVLCHFQGCGKSALVKRFAELLGYHIEPIMLYQVRDSKLGISKLYCSRVFN